MPLTNEQYLAKDGCVCPHCQSANITSSADVRFEGTVIFQPVQCHDCGEKWQDQFNLTGWWSGEG